jgi:hypothetical protein
VFVAFVHDRRSEPPWEPEPDPPPRRRLPIRALAWVAAWCWLLAAAGLVDHALGPLAGYVALLVVIAVGAWRVERWAARQYWQGLGEHRS